MNMNYFLSVFKSTNIYIYKYKYKNNVIIEREELFIELFL